MRWLIEYTQSFPQLFIIFDQISAINAQFFQIIAYFLDSLIINYSHIIMFLSKIFLLTCCMLRVKAAFTYEVTPSCKASDEECSFDFHVNYIMSMVAYNWTLFQGFPVYFKNGTMYKNNESPFENQRHSFEETTLSEKGILNIYQISVWFTFNILVKKTVMKVIFNDTTLFLHNIFWIRD